jgi:hypothetical protein
MPERERLPFRPGLRSSGEIDRWAFGFIIRIWSFGPVSGFEIRASDFNRDRKYDVDLLRGDAKGVVF